jgi:predicted transcriptional regulator
LYEWSRRIAEAVVGATAVENISRIRAILIPTVTDLAGLLSVSRQAIYDWQAGKPITAENSARLEELAKAVDLLAIEGLRGTSQALRRPIRNGKTFFDLVKEGAPAESAARGLIQIIRTENDQREALRKRLAGRKRPSREAFEDIGVPMLNEEER